jgi:hypothetical protein
MSLIGVGDHRSLSILSVLRGVENVDIIYGYENKAYSRYTEAQLRLLYRNIAGIEASFLPYSGLVEAVRACVMRIEPLKPTEEQLEATALQRLGPVVLPAPVQKTREPRIVAKKEPRGIRVSSEEVQRPKSGSTTGRVWEICDKLFERVQDKKELRAAVLAAASAEGINSSTISVQFGKWFSTQGSRVVT